jgi:hypothetical protein
MQFDHARNMLALYGYIRVQWLRRLVEVFAPLASRVIFHSLGKDHESLLKTLLDCDRNSTALEVLSAVLVRARLIVDKLSYNGFA